MKCKKLYHSPEILRNVAFAPGASLLAGSIVDNATVISQGQEVDTYQWNDQDQGFNHNWE